MKLELKKSIVVPGIIVLTGLILLNLISRNWFVRLDLTDNKMYSLSHSSRNVINNIDDLLTMKVYFSDDLPGEYGNNRRYLQDILEEYAAYSNGKIRFEFYRPDADDELEQEAQKSGIQPVQLQVIEDDKLEVKRVFMGMAILFEDRREVIPLIQTTTGLEYEITTRIKKLVETNKKTVAIARVKETDVTTRNIEMLINERYQVRYIELADPVPDNIDVVVMYGLEDSLGISESDNLKSFISRGGNLFITQSKIKTDIQTQRANVIQSDIFDFLKGYGLSLADNLVLDRICGKVSVQQNIGFFRMAVPMDYPFLPIVRNFNQEEVLVSGLEQMQFIFPSEIILDSIPENSNYRVTPLMYTSDRSSTMKGFFNLNPDPKANPALRRLGEKGKLLAARSEIVNQESGIVSQIILVADSRFLLDSGGGASPENHIFILNAIDYLVGDRGLISLRSREITSRPLEELADNTKSRWKWINIILPTTLIIAFGAIRFKRRSNRSKFLEELYD